MFRKVTKWVAITIGSLLVLAHGGCAVVITTEEPRIYAGTRAYAKIIKQGGTRYFSGDPTGTFGWWVGLPIVACVDTVLLVYTVPHALLAEDGS